MDKSAFKIIGVLQMEVREQLQSLGDFPKSDHFEHGVQVGIYQGLQKAMNAITKLIEDDEEEESRR